MTKGKTRLQDMFNNFFIRPLICGIFTSIIFTVTVLVIFANELSSSKDLIEAIQTAEEKRIQPILSKALNVIYKKFQEPINLLNTVKGYYSYLTRNGYLDTKDREKMVKFIEENSLNMKDMANMTYYEGLDPDEDKNSNGYDYRYGGWFTNPDNNAVKSLDDSTVENLYIAVNLNLLIRSFIEIKENETSTDIRLFQIFYPNTSLFYEYPKLKQSRYGQFHHGGLVNPSWCRDGDFEIPDYFFFECSKEFREMQSFLNEFGLDISISTPFTSEIGYHDIQICKKIEDDSSSSVVACVNSNFHDFVSIFNSFNNLLSGYIFLIRLNSDIPIYYPYFKMPENNPIARYNFPKDVSFYIDEVTLYKHNTKDFISSDNSSMFQEQSRLYGTMTRNGIAYNYTVIPVFLNSNDGENKGRHCLNMVYVNKKEAFMTTIIAFEEKLYPTLMFQIFLFNVVGSILFQLSRYLITSIALNIVKPLKMIKKSLEGMNNSKLAKVLSDSNSKTRAKQVDEDEGTMDENEELTINDEKEDNHIDNDDEYIETRSTDIDLLITRLIDLRNVISYTQDMSSSVDKENFLNFIFAKKTFDGVNNDKAKFICDSNVGNLAIKCKKYDKAILHLWNSIINPKNSFESSMTKLKQSICSSKTSENLSAKVKKSKKIKEKIEIDKKKKMFLDSRFPKLLYTFKKYYQNIFKLAKLMQNNDNQFDEQITQDFFSLSGKHTLDVYQQALEHYLSLASAFNDKKREAEALLELNEFFINFRLKPEKEGMTTYFRNYSNSEILLSKEELIGVIKDNFQKFDHLINGMSSSILTWSDYVKKMMDMIMLSRRNSLEAMETPIYVLNQIGNYLKGLLCYYCEEHSLALEFFNESRKNYMIGHAEIIKKSNKKIIKILNILLQRDSLMQIEKENTKNESSEEEAETARKMINFLKKEINSYMVMPKDIALMINVSYLSSSEKDSNEVKKKLDQSKNIALSIFDNLTTSDDRFSVFLYVDRLNSLVSLAYKNITTVDYIKDQIEKISDVEYLEDYMSREPPNIGKCLRNAYEYLEKKSGSESREKWIVVITDDVTEDEVEYMQQNSIQYSLFNGNEMYNIVVILLNKENTQKLRPLMNFNKSGVIGIHQLDLLKKKMRVIGKINDDVHFAQERYENYGKID